MSKILRIKVPVIKELRGGGVPLRVPKYFNIHPGQLSHEVALKPISANLVGDVIENDVEYMIYEFEFDDNQISKVEAKEDIDILDIRNK